MNMVSTVDVTAGGLLLAGELCWLFSVVIMFVYDE
jgi:hypothetical protein